MTALHVTDHAVLRYLERAWGVDVEGLRRRIARRMDGRPAQALSEMDGPPPSELCIVTDGVRYLIKTGDDGRLHVITVISVQTEPETMPARARRLRRRHYKFMRGG